MGGRCRGETGRDGKRERWKEGEKERGREGEREKDTESLELLSRGKGRFLKASTSFKINPLGQQLPYLEFWMHL